jgi:hypothetical protein
MAVGHVEQNGAPHHAGSGDDVAPFDLILVDAGQVDGHAAAGLDRLSFGFVGLQTANTAVYSRRLNFDSVAGLETAVEQRACDHRAKAGQAKNAVYRQTRPSQVRTGFHPGQLGLQDPLEFIQALPAVGGDGNNGRVGQDRARQRFAQVQRDQFQPVGVIDEVNFG